MNRSPVKIDELELMPMTVSILKRNGIATFDDLLLLDSKSIKTLEGLSRHRAHRVCECVEKWRNIFNTDGAKVCQSFDTESTGKIVYDSIGLYLKDQGVGNRNIEIFANYYRKSDLTLDGIASEYEVTRERIRQICGRCLHIIGNGFRNKIINQAILEKIEKAADRKTEITMVDVYDGLLGREGLVRVVTAIYNNDLKVASSQYLNGKWLVKKGDNINNMIDCLSRTLRERDTPHVD